MTANSLRQPKELPEGWRAAQLQEVASFHQGGRLKFTKADYSAAGVRAYSAAGQDGFVETVEEADQTAVILSSIGARCGKCFLAEAPWTTLANTQVIRPGPECDPRYIWQYVNNETYWHRSGSAQPFIKPTTVKQAWIALPPLPEQRKIAAILSSVDEVIEKTAAVIEQLQVVKKAMMQELLTRGLPGRHTRFKQTEIGEIPEAWEVVPLADCVRERIRNGYSPVCPKVPTGKWTLGLGAVGFGGFDPSGAKAAPPDDPKVDDTQLIPGDLLLSRSNTRERVGLVGIYRGDPSPCSYPDLLMRIRPNDRTTPEFLELTLLSGRGRDYFESAARGTSGSMVKVNRRIVEQFQVALPSSDEQGAIVEAGVAFDCRRDAEIEVLAHLRSVKAALMSVLLSGTVRVEPDEVAF